METGEKTKYLDSELLEFEEIIQSKLGRSKEELQQLKESITKSSESGSNSAGLEDSVNTQEKEHLNSLAARTSKFIKQLEDALIRIKIGTYGVCVETGKLIPKERLRAVPHTQYCIEVKQQKD